MDEKLLNRITKLLALGNSDQPNEAASAIAKAQALMEEHGLTRLDVKANAIGEVSIESYGSISKPKQFEINLIMSIAEAFGGVASWSSGYGRNNGKYNIYAPKEYLPIVQHTIVVTRRRLLAARTQYLNTQLPANFPRMIKAQKGDAYCDGWVYGIKKAITKLSGIEDHAEAARAKMKSMTDGVATSKKRVNDAASIMAGYADGGRETLNRPVSGDAQLQIGG